MSVYPMVHMNGTGKRMLMNDYKKALKDCKHAIDSLREVEFHERDYYVISPSAFESAKRERIEMFKRLEEVKTYIEQHIVNVYRQNL